MFMKLNTGFTIIELMVAILIMASISTIVVTNFPVMQKQVSLNNVNQELIAVLRLAQVKAMTAESNSAYGVYFNYSVTPNKYILFKGSSYASRDTTADRTYSFPRGISMGVSLTPTGQQVVFSKITGVPQAYGTILLSAPAVNKGDSAIFKTIGISSSGVLNPEYTNGDTDRVKDSRHIAFDYTRTIDINNESIVLSYNSGTVVHTFPISAYLTSGQIELTDVADVGGTSQTVRVKTVLLNSTGPKTTFHIYRDRRYNDKSVTITISGDTSGSLVQYSADGVTTTSSSVYITPSITNTNWQ